MTTSPGTALVTGASAGIGAVYADRLARRGYDLILVARDRPRLDALAAELRATGAAVSVLAADLADPAGRLAVERRLRDDPAITLLVNNAGTVTPADFVGADLDALERMIALNVTAVTRLAAAAAGAFAARGRGAIINVASVLALAPEQFHATYSGTKAFVLTLSLGVHQELQAKGVRVQAVLPGATRTAIWTHAGRDASDLPAEMVMEPGEMVDAALAGFDQGELVTIPSLPDAADWEAFTAARLKLGPNLSRNRAADRYRAIA